jgi:hypothetical protein
MLSNLAEFYCHTDIAYGETLYEQLLEKRRRVLYEHHPDLIMKMFVLADVYARNGKIDQSVKLLHEAMAAKKAAEQKEE